MISPNHETALRPRIFRAFTLIELLTVVTMVSLLLGLTAPALIGSFRSSSITFAGNQLADLTSLARQSASSKNVLTALVFAQNIPHLEGRAVGMMEYGPDRQWKSVGTWTILPESVYAVVPSGQNLPAATGTPDIKYRGTTVATDHTLVFYPDGRMRQAATPTVTVRVVAKNDASSAGAAANFYDIVLNRDNSGYQIKRP